MLLNQIFRPKKTQNPFLKKPKMSKFLNLGIQKTWFEILNSQNKKSPILTFTVTKLTVYHLCCEYVTPNNAVKSLEIFIFKKSGSSETFYGNFSQSNFYDFPKTFDRYLKNT